MPTCPISGEEFPISQNEYALRKKMGIDSIPEMAPWVRIRELGAFWQHWNLYKRSCEKTGKSIISSFSPECPYPIWHKEEWQKNTQPPLLEISDFSWENDFFTQAWTLFSKCPIPHNVGINCENCEYTDDWWNSQNCYLCHSGYNCQDLRYCYRTYNCRDCYFSVFCNESELCIDLIQSEKCFECVYLLNCRQMQRSAFCYDCRNCQDCMFCFNLRNKKYCFGNEQYSKEAYEKKKAEWNLKSEKNYQKAKGYFVQMMKEMAWHRSLQIDMSENSTGNFLDRTSNCEMCFFVNDAQDTVNGVRAGIGVKDCLDYLSNGGGGELCYQTIGCGINSYDIKNSFNVFSSQFCEYSAFCERCEHCFACCGLVGKKYHVFNKPYAEKEYFSLREKLIAHMKKTGEYGKFFPGYFAPCGYDQSWSAYYWPLDEAQKKHLGFRSSYEEGKKNTDIPSALTLPDETDRGLAEQVFWDEVQQKPFQIQAADLDFTEKMGVPFPHTHYMRRIQENFKWLFYNGKLRTTVCAKTGESIETNWPVEYDGRILSEAAYLEIIR